MRTYHERHVPKPHLDQAQFLPVFLTVNMLRKQKLCLSKLLGAPFEFIEHGYKLKHVIQLECGHAVCEACAGYGKPRIITCGICSTKTQVKSVTTPDLPRNSNTPAPQDAAPSGPSTSEGKIHTCMQGKNFCSYVGRISRLCDSCYKRLAALTCHTCDRFLCDYCWSQVHPEDSWLGHVPLSVNSAKLKVFGRCKVHRTKFVELYCQECGLYACQECAHRKHNEPEHHVIPVPEKNMRLLQKLKEMSIEVEENMKRMENTILRVVALKEATEKITYSDFSKETIEKFINEQKMLRTPEESLRQKLKRQEANRRIDLDHILTQLRGQIELINILLSDVQTVSNSETLLQKISVQEYFPILLELKYAPCYLEGTEFNREEDNADLEQPSLPSDEELLEEVKTFFALDYPKSTIELVNIEGQTNSDLGHETETGRSSRAKTALVTQGQIVSGTPGDSRSRPRARVGFYSSLNLMRFSNNKNRSVVAEGCSYGVYLTYVKDPGEFYVVRTAARKHQQRIERLAPTLVDRCGRAPRRLQKDELYLVQCVLDRKWYRGRVIEVLTRRTPNEDSSVLIFNLDYGNTQVVPHNRLRVMPNLLQAEPPMALRCRLSECIPVNGKWCQQATKMMTEMMKGGVVTMYVVRILPDIMEVDLSRKTDDCSLLGGEMSSLRDSMVFMEYSLSMTNPHIAELRKSMVAKYPHFLMPKVNSTFTGIITCVLSSTNIYMQKISIDTDYLIDLMERINMFYDLHNQKGYIYNPVIGMPCVAISTQDYLWYRAKIVDLPGHDKFAVQYVDYGYEDTLNYKFVRKIRPEFRRLPPQAFLCRLENMKSPSDRKWKFDQRAFLKKLTEDTIQVKVLSAESEELEVELLVDPSISRFDPAEVQIPDPLLGMRPARPFFRIRPSALTGLNFDMNIALDASDSGKVAKLMELYNNAITSEEYTQTRREPARDSNNDLPKREEINVKIGEHLGIKIKILKVTSPSDICVSIESFLPRMQDLQRELQEFYMFKAVKKSSPWTIGNYCAVHSYSRGKWLRGFVQDIMKNDMIMVEYFDTIGTEEVPVSSLRVLDPHFLSYPIGVIKCHLDDMPRPKTDWPEHVKERLISELEKHDKVYMTTTGKIEEDYSSLSIKLWVKVNEETEAEPEPETKTEPEAEIKTDIGAEIKTEPEAEIKTDIGAEIKTEPEAETKTEIGAVINTEPETEAEKKPCNGKWVSLKDLIDEEGSELSEKEYVSHSSVENPEGELEKPQDPCELEKPQDPSNEGEEKYILDENDFKLSTDLSPELFRNTDANGNKDRLCDWALPRRSTVKYFTGEPTHVDSDGTIYMHDVERDGPAMEFLQYSLYQFYKDTTPDPFDIWEVNDICVAKYYIDNCWYRGRILEIEDGICRVFFVDFGHVENCPYSWLRKSTTFIETPILARKYQLFGVTPVSLTGDWVPQAIDKMYATIIEKKCFITVVENEPDTIPKVYVRVREYDQDLAEYLVTLGMATYCPEMDYAADDFDDSSRNFFDDRFQDFEVFPVAPVTQAYNSGYRPLDIPTVCFPFPIKITTVKEYHICANIVDDEAIYPRLRRNMYSLQRLTDQMQILGDQQPLLNNVRPGVACLCLHGVTGNWHRAEIEGVDTAKDLILVHYVDYGYTEYVTKDRIRTILPRWFEIPRMALNCKLYRLKKNPEIRRKVYLKELNEALSHPDIMVTIMQKCKDFYEVEMRRKNCTELVYQRLIDEGLLLPLEEDEIDYFDGFEFEDDDEEEEEEERMRESQGNEGNREPEEREGPDEREGPEERQGPEECNGPAECEGSADGEGSDETEDSEDMDGSDDDDDDDEEEEEDEDEDEDDEIDFEVEEEEEEGEGEGVEEEEEWEEEEEEMEELGHGQDGQDGQDGQVGQDGQDGQDGQEGEHQNEQPAEEEHVEIEVD